MAQAVQGGARSCAGWPKKWAAENPKDRCKCGQRTNLRTLRSKIRRYLEVMTRLQVSVRRKRPKLWPHKRVRMMRWEFALLAQKFITNMNLIHLTAPCDFWLFPKLKKKCPVGIDRSRTQTMGFSFRKDKDLLTILTNNTAWRYREVFRTKISKTVSGSDTIVSPSAELHKESISEVTAAASAQVRKFFHSAIPGIKLSHLIHYRNVTALQTFISWNRHGKAYATGHSGRISVVKKKC
jgi:hypothetical protein